MKNRPNPCELIITPLLPINIVKDVYIIKSRIQEGFLILGPGFLSMSAIFMDPEETRLLDEVIDFEKMELRPQFKSRTLVLAFERVGCCSLLTTSDSNPSRSGTSVFRFLEGSSVSILESSIMTSLIQEKIKFKKIHPQRDWTKLPLIKTELPTDYSLDNSHSRTETVIYSWETDKTYTIHDTTFELENVKYSITELHTVQGNVYLLATDASMLEETLKYLELCLSIAKRFKCYVTIWGFGKIAFEVNQFSLKAVSRKELYASIFTRLTDHHLITTKDYRAGSIKSLVEGELTPAISTVESSPETIAQEIEITNSTLIPNSSQAISDIIQGPILGHIVHTHIIKYEFTGSQGLLPPNYLPKIDESIIKAVSTQVVPSVIKEVLEARLSADELQSVLPSKSNANRPCPQAAVPSKRPEADNSAHIQALISNQSRKKVTRKPINQSDSHQKASTVESQVDANKKIISKPQPFNNLSVNTEANCKLNSEQQLSLKNVINQFIAGQSKGSTKRIPINPVSPKKESAPSSQKKIALGELLSAKNSSKKKPVIPQPNYLEDHIVTEKADAMPSHGQQMIHEFGFPMPYQAPHVYSLHQNKKRSRLNLDAPFFSMTDGPISMQAYPLDKVNEAKDYFKDF